MTIVDGMRKTQEAKESVKTEYKISDQEKDSIGKQIEKYQNYKSTGDVEADKKAGANLLKKMEDGARLDSERLKKQHLDEPKNEEKKIKYYKANDKYKLIAKMTGIDSPAKVALREGLEEAKVKQKKLIVT